MSLIRAFICTAISVLLVACGNPYEEGKVALSKLDYDTALSKFKKSSSSGNVDATLQVAEMYKKGQGGGVNEEEAVRWYKLAADSGNAEAMFNLGDFYLKGYLPNNSGRVILSKEEALRWFTLAAEKGHPGAQYIAAWHLMNDPTKDQSSVIRWLRNAASNGVKLKDWSDPIGSIVIFYDNNKDFLKAYKWSIIYQSKIDDPKEKNKFDYLMKHIEGLPNYSESKCLKSMAYVIKNTGINLPSDSCEKQENINFTFADLKQAHELAGHCLANNLKDCD